MTDGGSSRDRPWLRHCPERSTVSGHHAEIQANAWGDWVLRTWGRQRHLGQLSAAQIPQTPQNGDRIRLGLSTQFIFGSAYYVSPYPRGDARADSSKFEQMTGQLFEKLCFVSSSHQAD